MKISYDKYFLCVGFPNDDNNNYKEVRMMRRRQLELPDHLPWADNKWSIFCTIMALGCSLSLATPNPVKLMAPIINLSMWQWQLNTPSCLKSEHIDWNWTYSILKVVYKPWLCKRHLLSSLWKTSPPFSTTYLLISLESSDSTITPNCSYSFLAMCSVKFKN